MANPRLQAALQRDIEGILASGVTFLGNREHLQETDLEQMCKQYSCVYITKDQLSGPQDPEASVPFSDPVAQLTGLFIGEEFLINGVSVVEAVAIGRRAALEICKYLNLSA